MQIWIPIVSALAAALVGAWLNDRFRRPRLRLIPTSLGLSTYTVPEGSVVEPHSELLSLCSENPYVKAPPFLGVGKVDERGYVSYLTEVLEGSREYVRVEFPAIAERAQELQSKLSADDFEGVCRLWARNQLQLWSAVEGPYVRKEFTLDPAGADEDGGSPANSLNFETGEEPDGTVYAGQLEPPYTVLVFRPDSRRIGPSLERSKEIGTRLCQAFVQGKKPDLIRVFNFLARIERESPALENLIQKIEDELSRLKRLSVTALISNTGGSPVSISKPRCSMRMRVSGYPYRIGENEAARQVTRRDDCTLDMLIVDERGGDLPPIVVPAGGVQPIRAVYKEPLAAEPVADGGSLYDLVRSSLDGSERTWTLAVEAVLPRDPAKTIESRRLSFQDLKEPESESTLRRPAVPDSAEQLREALTAKDAELAAARAELNAARTQATMAQRDWMQLVTAVQVSRSAASATLAAGGDNELDAQNGQ